VCRRWQPSTPSGLSTRARSTHRNRHAPLDPSPHLTGLPPRHRRLDIRRRRARSPDVLLRLRAAGRRLGMVRSLGRQLATRGRRQRCKSHHRRSGVRCPALNPSDKPSLYRTVYCPEATCCQMCSYSWRMESVGAVGARHVVASDCSVAHHVLVGRAREFIHLATVGHLTSESRGLCALPANSHRSGFPWAARRAIHSRMPRRRDRFFEPAGAANCCRTRVATLKSAVALLKRPPGGARAPRPGAIPPLDPGLSPAARSAASPTETAQTQCRVHFRKPSRHRVNPYRAWWLDFSCSPFRKLNKFQA